MQRIIPAFRIENLEIKLDGQPFMPIQDYDLIKIQQWKKLEKKIGKNGNIWNGLIYRLSSLTHKNEKKVLHLNTIDFKTHFFTDYADSLFKKLPFKKRPNGMYIAAYIKTSDDKLLFGYRSGNSLARKKINFIGGSLNKDEMEIVNSNDIYNYFIKELREETGIDEIVIQSIDGLGVFISDNYKIAIILRVELKISEDMICEKSELNFEHEKLVFFNQSELLNTEHAKNFNPNILGSLKIYLNEERRLILNQKVRKRTYKKKRSSLAHR